MRFLFPFVLAVSFCFTSPRSRAGEIPPATQSTAEPAELDLRFERVMTNASLAGQFTIDGENTAPKKDHYTIVSVKKLRGDLWLFNARIQFGSKDVTVPLVLPVVWAGDTPIITVTNVGVPGIGSYTARVMIFDDHYAGVWSGGPTHQGLLFGRIEHAAPASAPATNR